VVGGGQEAHSLTSEQGSRKGDSLAGRLSPPSSPNMREKEKGEDLMDLQLDYWGDKLHGVKGDQGDTAGGKKSDVDGRSKKGQDMKNSIKTTFRNLSVSHLSLSPQAPPSEQTFTLHYSTKEKKQKVIGMKIGKKKEKNDSHGTDRQHQSIEGVSRLICLNKSSHPLRVAIDGHEWFGVKFFQLSSAWQTHIKYLPVAVSSTPHHAGMSPDLLP